MSGRLEAVQRAASDLDAAVGSRDWAEVERVTAHLKSLVHRSLTVSYSTDAITRPDTAAPADWTPQPDGTWRSPHGRTWRASAPHVQRVIAKRVALGLPVSCDASERAS